MLKQFIQLVHQIFRVHLIFIQLTKLIKLTIKVVIIRINFIMVPLHPIIMQFNLINYVIIIDFNLIQAHLTLHCYLSCHLTLITISEHLLDKYF